jgi:hypothetical protein
MLNNGTDTNIALIRINGHINSATWLRICSSVKFKAFAPTDPLYLHNSRGSGEYADIAGAKIAPVGKT